MHKLLLVLASATIFSFAPGCSGTKAPARAPDQAPAKAAKTPDQAAAPAPEELARYEPSPPAVVSAMLDIAAIKPQDVVYDLGCGDGRIVIGAAKRYGARGVGLDIDPQLVALARENAHKEGVEKLAAFRQEDILAADFSDATVVMLFLSAHGNEKLEEKLRTRLAPGTRVVSHCHDIEGWTPEKKVEVEVDGRSHTVFLWVVKSAKVAESLAPFVPTPMPIVRKMLDIAGVTKDDVVYDLGCGDGRIVVEAAKHYGAKGVGIDFDQQRCREARERAQREGVTERVEIRHGDVLQADFSDATVVTLYLLPTSNVKLRPKLEALRPGTRIVSHDFAIGDWEPIKKEVFTIDTEAQQHTVYLWHVGQSGGAQERGKEGR